MIEIPLGLPDPEAVAIANQDQRLIPNRVPVAAGGGDHRLHFALMEPVARGLTPDFALFVA
jgi:hypothetical protein